MKCVCSFTEHRNKCEFASRVLTISEYFLLRAAEATFITLTSKERLSTNLRKVAQYPKKNPNRASWRFQKGEGSRRGFHQALCNFAKSLKKDPPRASYKLALLIKEGPKKGPSPGTMQLREGSLRALLTRPQLVG